MNGMGGRSTRRDGTVTPTLYIRLGGRNLKVFGTGGYGSVRGVFGPWSSGGWVKTSPSDRVDVSGWTHMEYGVVWCGAGREARLLREWYYARLWPGSGEEVEGDLAMICAVIWRGQAIII